MPAVLVHGVPENPVLWASLVDRLDRHDVVTPALPGFTTERPDGFGATMDEYSAWLIDLLEGIGEPVDLVGHDWGGGFTVRVVSLRPDLVRTWVTDAAGLADAEFEWHDFAKIWQTPGAGEEFWQNQLATPAEERTATFTAFGASEEDAHAIAAGIDETMAQCILDLYRSATTVESKWGPEFADIPKQGMVVVPELDPFLDAEAATRSGKRAGARIETLPGVGHWWMLQKPDEAAALLQDFWTGRS